MGNTQGELGADGGPTDSPHVSATVRSTGPASASASPVGFGGGGSGRAAPRRSPPRSAGRGPPAPPGPSYSSSGLGLARGAPPPPPPSAPTFASPFGAAAVAGSGPPPRGPPGRPPAPRQGFGTAFTASSPLDSGGGWGTPVADAPSRTAFGGGMMGPTSGSAGLTSAAAPASFGGAQTGGGSMPSWMGAQHTDGRGYGGYSAGAGAANTSYARFSSNPPSLDNSGGGLSFGQLQSPRRFGSTFSAGRSLNGPGSAARGGDASVPPRWNLSGQFLSAVQRRIMDDDFVAWLLETDWIADGDAEDIEYVLDAAARHTIRDRGQQELHLAGAGLAGANDSRALASRVARAFDELCAQRPGTPSVAAPMQRRIKVFLLMASCGVLESQQGSEAYRPVEISGKLAYRSDSVKDTCLSVLHMLVKSSPAPSAETVDSVRKSLHLLRSMLSAFPAMSLADECLRGEREPEKRVQYKISGDVADSTAAAGIVDGSSSFTLSSDNPRLSVVLDVPAQLSVVELTWSSMPKNSSLCVVVRLLHRDNTQFATTAIPITGLRTVVQVDDQVDTHQVEIELLTPEFVPHSLTHLSVFTPVHSSVAIGPATVASDVQVWLAAVSSNGDLFQNAVECMARMAFVTCGLEPMLHLARALMRRHSVQKGLDSAAVEIIRSILLGSASLRDHYRRIMCLRHWLEENSELVDAHMSEQGHMPLAVLPHKVLEGDSPSAMEGGLTVALSGNSVASVEYDLAGSFESFRATCGLHPSVESGSGHAATFQVVADGAVIFDSGACAPQDERAVGSLSVQGVQKLRLVTSCHTDQATTGVWASLMVECNRGDVAALIPSDVDEALRTGHTEDIDRFVTRFEAPRGDDAAMAAYDAVPDGFDSPLQAACAVLDTCVSTAKNAQASDGQSTRNVTFGLQFTESCFQSLADLLEELLVTRAGVDETMTDRSLRTKLLLGVIELASIHFDIVVKSRHEPMNVGLTASSIARLGTVLEGLAHEPTTSGVVNRAVRAAAEAFIVSGFEVLYTDAASRLSVVRAMLSEICNSTPGSVSREQWTQFDTLLSRFAASSTMSMMVPEDIDVVVAASGVMSFVEQLLELWERQSVETLRGSTVKYPDIVQSLGDVTLAFLRHLIARSVNASPHAALGSACCRIILAILESAQRILALAVEQSADSAFDESRLQEALRLSPVGQLLPFVSVATVQLLKLQKGSVAISGVLRRSLGHLDALNKIMYNEDQRADLARLLERHSGIGTRIARNPAVSDGHPSFAPKNVFAGVKFGDADSFSGQVGFQFSPTRTLRVYALGRSVNAKVHAGHLQREHVVRIWDVESREELVSATVTDACMRDGLGFAIAHLVDAISLFPGQMYCLTSDEHEGCGDTWYDGTGEGGAAAVPVDVADLQVVSDCFHQGSVPGFPATSSGREGTALGLPTLFCQPIVSGAAPGGAEGTAVPNSMPVRSVQHSDVHRLPWLLDVQRTLLYCCSVGATVAAEGRPPESGELEMRPWLQLPVFRHGRLAPEKMRGGDFMSQLAEDTGDRKSGVGGIVIAWLETLAPEGAIDRRRAVYPACERPLFAAMVRQAGLQQEVQSAHAALAAGQTPSDISDELQSVWKSLKSARQWLRSEKRKFAMHQNVREQQAAALGVDGATIVLSDSESDSDDDEAAEEQGASESKAAGAERESKDAEAAAHGPRSAQTATERQRRKAWRARLKRLKPRDMAGLCRQFVERANLVLAFKGFISHGTEADEEHKSSSTRESASTAEELCRQCLFFVKSAVGVTAAELEAAVTVRNHRAKRRAAALRTFTELLRYDAFPSSPADVLLFLRPCIGPHMIAQSLDQRTAAASLHHPFRDVEGADQSEQAELRSVFADIVQEIVRAVSEAIRRNDAHTVHVGLSNLAFDYLPHDWLLLQSTGLLQLLADSVSARATTPLIPLSPGLKPVDVELWPADIVQRELEAGSLSTSQVLDYMNWVPEDLVPSTWWSENRVSHLKGGTDLAVDASALSLHYSAFYRVGASRLLALRREGSDGESATLTQMTSFASQRDHVLSRSLWSTYRYVLFALLGGSTARLQQHLEQQRQSSIGVSILRRQAEDDHAADLRQETSSSAQSSPWSTAARLASNPPPDIVQPVLDILRNKLHEAAVGGASHTGKQDCLEQHVYETLALLHATVREPVISELAESAPVLADIVSLSCKASPRCRVSATRLLRVLLPQASVDAVNTIAASSLSSDASLVSVMLEKVQRGLCVSRLTGVESESAAHGCGAVAANDGVEAGSLLRLLCAANEAWEHEIHASLTSTILQSAAALADHAEGDPERSSAISMGAAALAVVGALPSFVRSGARVSVAQNALSTVSESSATGTVVTYQPGHETALVAFGEIGATSVQELPVSQLVPVDDVAPIANIRLAGDLISSFGAFLSINVPNEVATAMSESKVESDSRGEQEVEDDDKQLPPITAGVAETVLLKAKAVQALSELVSGQVAGDVHAVASLVPKLVDASLVPVSLSSFVSLRYLQERHNVLQCHVLESSLVPLSTMFAPQDAASPHAVQIQRADAADAAVVVGGGSGAAVVEEVVSPEDAARRESAAFLASMGFGFDIDACVVALKHNGDDANRAAEWLMTNPDEAERLIAADRSARPSATGVPSSRATHESAARRSVQKDEVRWTKARELADIYGQPVHLCFHALMMHAEDPNAAMGWLMDVGARYVEQFTDAAMSKAAEEEDKLADAQTRAQERLSDKAALEDIGHTLSLMGDSSRPDKLVAGEGEDNEAKSAAIRAAHGASQASLERPSAPTGADEPESAATGLLVGCLISSTTSIGPMDDIVGVSGSLVTDGVIVRKPGDGESVDTATTIIIRWISPSTGVSTYRALSIDTARLHDRLYARPVRSASDVLSMRASTDAALISHFARRATAAVLASDGLKLEHIGGPVRLIQLIKLSAAAEGVFKRDADGSKAAADGAHDLVGSLRRVLRQLLQVESTAGASASVGVLSHSLVNECVANFVTSTTPASSAEKKTADSLHPYFHQSDYRGEIYFEGAKALRVAFDPRCDLGSSNTTLSFYSDRDCTSGLIARFHGTTSFTPVIVHADKLFYRFQSNESPGEHGWGYRFHISPMRGLQWLREGQVLADPSLEWACWLLSFLLNDVVELTRAGAVHNRKVYDALVRYLRKPGSPYKYRVISLLAQLLSRPQLFTADQLPDINPLAGVAQLVMKRCQDEKQASHLFLPPGLLQLVELSVTAATAQRYLMRCHPIEFKALHDAGGRADTSGTKASAPVSGEERKDVSPVAPLVGAAGAGGSLEPLRAGASGGADGAAVPEDDEDGAKRPLMLMAAGSGAVPKYNAATVSESETGPLDPPLELSLPPTKLSVLDGLVDIADMSTCLLNSTRLPDMLMCHAWLDAAGFSTVIESPHPYKRGKLKGTVSIEGASRLVLRFDHRCSFNGKLVVVGENETQVVVPPTAAALSEPLVLEGSSLRYKFISPDVNDAGLWGFGMTVVAVDIAGKRKRQLMRLATGVEDVTRAIRVNAGWTKEMDEVLVDWVNEHALNSGISSSDILPEHVRPTKEQFQYKYERLDYVPLGSIQLRFAVLAQFNARLKMCIELLDFTGGSELAHSLGYRLRSLRHLIFSDVKAHLFDAAMEMTWSPSDAGVRVKFDNMKAMHSREAGERGLTASQCMFAQAFKQLFKQPVSMFRARLDGKERLFHVDFAGEEGMDWGGLFRDAVNRVVEDLFSPSFSLLELCPNGRLSVGMNNEKYLPNPNNTSPRAVDMFEFVGRLMGMSMRTKMCLPFDFPSIVWKQLVGEHCDESDLAAVDVTFAKQINAIRHCEAEGVADASEFEAKYPEQCFTVFSSAGRDVELMPGGSSIRVTFDNRVDYCAKAVAHRLHEFDTAVAAMRKGLTAVVPERALQLLTWQEVDIAVAGRPEINIDLLYKHTEYEGYRKDDEVIKAFWNVMRSFSDEERTLFIRFVWGRSRLPMQKRWPRKMKITRRSTTEDELPRSHTCFFSVELPPYSTEAIMRKRILAAVHFGLGGILNA